MQEQFDPAFAKDSIHILAVDDEPVARMVLKKGLTRCGYKATVVDSAKKALEALEKDSYHILMSDVLMPDMDGLELLEEIRKLPDTKDMTIIMVSATEDLSTVYKCLQKGADDYMVKPIRLPQINNLWSNIWKKRREREISEQLSSEKIKRETLDAKIQTLQTKLSELNTKIDAAVDTPINAITRTIADLKTNQNLTPEVQSALGSVLQSLASSNLYKPAFTKVMKNTEVDVVTKKWLMSEMGGTTTEIVESDDNGRFGGVQWSAGTESEVKELRSFEYDVWTKREEELVVYLNNIFNDFDLLRMFKIDPEVFKRFLLEIRANYHSYNPYHNFIHAFDVTQSVYAYLTDGKGATKLGHLEILSLLLAAICHDVGHFGLNNPFLIATKHELAIRYNDQSVLESFHTATAFSIIFGKSGCNVLANMDRADQLTARKLMINCILATDLSKHMELFNKLSGVVDSFSSENADHRLLLMQFLLKSADISNPAKPFPVARYWAEMVQEEFFMQGDQEKALGLDVSGFMDREKPQLALMQIGFADYFVVPTFTLLAKLLPDTKFCLELLIENRKTWADIRDNENNNTAAAAN